ncbi:adenylate/guanylate cyclase domain-containing protein [Actinokineospora sp. PR83]|uniref:adenylate/guanylate cyclase domain-containing protein n=1 Tax=Actinokineospora sp. PR83 TaxID=2884908 RepID=UPI0027DEDBC9|nr:adenylate/guanylate cyclase domain-containing protein [Actinokineospora sp. PR83]MCG8914572.1 adenylate/guanylate cyclase domain-containing protein [Actinokineospora sp. PR83]
MTVWLVAVSVVAVGALVAVLVLSILLGRSRRRYARLLASTRSRPESRPRLGAGPRAEGLLGATHRAVRIANTTAARLRRHGVGGLLLSSLDDLTRWAEEHRGELARVTAPDGTITFVFTDIIDSTTLNEELGDKAWVRLLQAHDHLVRTQVDTRGGHVVKSLGDGFMVAFSTPEPAISAAIAIQHALAQRKHKALRATPITVRIGIHRGPAITRDGDYFGRTVATAARVAAQAGSEEVLVSADTLDGLPDPGRFRLAEPRRTELKGLKGDHALHPVEWTSHQPV